MDSISHATMGTGIAVLAISSGFIPSEYTITAYTTIIVASLLPDIDVVTKLFGNKQYINNHRGFTHSLIMFFVLSIGVNFILNMLIESEFKNVFLPWIMLAIGMHVLTDIFNNYGVKLLWPFVDKWISISATYTVDIVVISANVIGLILYFVFGLNGALIFTIVLLGSIIYLLILTIRREYRIAYIKSKIHNVKRVYLTAKSKPHQWKFVAQTFDGVYNIGELDGNKLTILQTQMKQRRIDDDLYHYVKNDKNLQIFIKFSKVYNWDIKVRNHITEIRLKDLTYYTKINKKYIYLFNCVLYFNNETKEIENTYVGFTTGDKSLYKMVEHQIGPTKFFKKIFKRKGDIKG